MEILLSYADIRTHQMEKTKNKSIERPWAGGLDDCGEFRRGEMRGDVGL